MIGQVGFLLLSVTGCYCINLGGSFVFHPHLPARVQDTMMSKDILKSQGFNIQSMHSVSSFHFIHPFYSDYPIQGHGLLECIPAMIGRETGYTLHRSPACYRASTEKQTTSMETQQVFNQMAPSDQVLHRGRGKLPFNRTKPLQNKQGKHLS